MKLYPYQSYTNMVALSCAKRGGNHLTFRKTHLVILVMYELFFIESYI